MAANDNMELSREDRLKIAAEEIRLVRDRFERSRVGTGANRTFLINMLIAVETAILADDNADAFDDIVKAMIVSGSRKIHGGESERGRADRNL